jgi:hypothetical protein
LIYSIFIEVPCLQYIGYSPHSSGSDPHPKQKKMTEKVEDSFGFDKEDKV